MNKRIMGIIQIAVAAIVVLSALMFSGELSSFSEYGYLGVFIISMISAASLFFPAPGWAVVIAMSTTLNPYALGIIAGIGSAIGELTGYLAGDGARKMIHNRIKEVKKAEEIMERYGPTGVFFLAFIPNPVFDIAGIVAGSMRMHWAVFLASCALGRILRYVLLAYFSIWALGFVG